MYFLKNLKRNLTGEYENEADAKAGAATYLPAGTQIDWETSMNKEYGSVGGEPLFLITSDN